VVVTMSAGSIGAVAASLRDAALNREVAHG